MMASATLVQVPSQSVAIVDSTGKLTPNGISVLQGFSSALNGTAVGTSGVQMVQLGNGLQIYYGPDTPGGAGVGPYNTAPVGSIFLSTLGGADTTLWVRESTGWIGK